MPRKLLAAFAAVLIAVAVIAAHSSQQQYTTELRSRIPGPVASLERLSEKLLKRDESPSFKESVRKGQHMKLLSAKDSDVTKTVLDGAKVKPVLKARIQPGNTMALAETVSRMFPESTIKALASKKTHAAGAKQLIHQAVNIEQKEEIEALRRVIARSRKEATLFEKKRARMLSADTKDNKEIATLKSEVKKYRHDFMTFGRKGAKSIENKAEIEEEAKMLDRAAHHLEQRAAKLQAVNKKASAKASLKKKSGVHLSKREEVLLKKNKKVIATYDKLKKEMAEDKHEALEVMQKAALARSKALQSMQRAGSLLSEADNTNDDGTPDTKSQKKMQAKLRGQSGSLTRKAVSLLMGTRQASEKAFNLRRKAQSLQVQIENMRSSVHAARLSDKILEDPSLLSHPREFDAAETRSPDSVKSSIATKKAKALERLAIADRAKAQALLSQLDGGKRANINSAPKHESKQTRDALLVQEENVRRKAIEERRRAEEALARKLGDELNREHRLQADIKHRQARLEQIEKEGNRAERRAAFEESVISHLEN